MRYAMRSTIIAALSIAAAVLAERPASAAPCAAYPNTLTNGTTADATPVNGNFTSLLNCANAALASLASPGFTGYVSIQAAQGLSFTGTFALPPAANSFVDIWSTIAGYEHMGSLAWIRTASSTKTQEVP
jgi:hypothetical protein